MVNSKLRIADAEFALLAAPSGSAREVKIHNSLFRPCAPRGLSVRFCPAPYIWGP
jgi:hypothetical protein